MVVAPRRRRRRRRAPCRAAAPHFVARAILRSLLGSWTLERRLDSRLPSHPSGRFRGTAQFLLRDRTPDGLAGGDDGDRRGNGAGAEYLYVEDGDFTADGGLSFRATRRYVWRYDEARDALSVWFARPDDARRADYLFHELEFRQPNDRARGWSARAAHDCVADNYDVD